MNAYHGVEYIWHYNSILLPCRIIVIENYFRQTLFNIKNRCVKKNIYDGGCIGKKIENYVMEKLKRCYFITLMAILF